MQRYTVVRQEICNRYPPFEERRHVSSITYAMPPIWREELGASLILSTEEFSIQCELNDNGNTKRFASLDLINKTDSEIVYHIPNHANLEFVDANESKGLPIGNISSTSPEEYRICVRCFDTLKYYHVTLELQNVCAEEDLQPFTEISNVGIKQMLW